jgi:uncharacterized damage-inducible protein DinB
MRRMRLTLMFLFIPAALHSQTLTEAERETVLSSLEQTDEQIVKLAETLTPDQWNFKPAEDSWSVAEVAEHLVLAERLIKQFVTGPLMATPVTDEAIEMSAAEMRANVMDRTQKFQAPEQAVPEGTWPTQAELLAVWRAERSATIEYVATTDADLHGHMFQHPGFGLIDGQQWMLYLAIHCERHMLQIEAVMADPDFPAGTN